MDLKTASQGYPLTNPYSKYSRPLPQEGLKQESIIPISQKPLSLQTRQALAQPQRPSTQQRLFDDTSLGENKTTNLAPNSYRQILKTNIFTNPYEAQNTENPAILNQRYQIPIGVQNPTENQRRYFLQSQECPTHPLFDITNICISKECIEPLCPECVKSHTYSHNQNGIPAEIDTIFNKREQCIQYVQELKSRFIKEEEILLRIGDVSKGDEFANQCFESILQAKDVLIKQIEAFFIRFEVQLKQRIHDLQIAHPTFFSGIHSNIIQIIRELEELENSLESSHYVKHVIEILENNLKVDYEKIQQEVDDGVHQYLDQLFHVQINEGIIQDLDNLLNRFLTTSKIDYEKFSWRDGEKQQDGTDKLRSIFENQQKVVAQQQYELQRNIKQVQKQFVPQKVNIQQQDIEQSPNNKTELSNEGVAINMYDYFTPDSDLNILHFFQDNSKSFHLLNLLSISKDPSSQIWLTVELNIPFKIPMFHRSIATPNGKIFLIGGIDARNKNKTISNTYHLDLSKNTLDLCSHLITPRHSHTLAFAQDSIFAIGGLSSQEEDIYLASCERFDVESSKWIQLANMKEGVSGATVCNFDDKFIYRFGGKTILNQFSEEIERYQIQNDVWETITYSQFEGIPSFAGAVQINENEILILGGQVQELNQRGALVAYVNEDSISFSQTKSLPTAGTFWQNPIIGTRILFAVQNMKMENSSSNFFNKKTVLIFNSQSWKELGRN